MDHPETTRVSLIRESIETFWQTVPPVWRNLKAYTHQTAMQNYQITMAQFSILREIHHGKTSVSQLAEAGHISRPAISRLVDILVRKDLISRLEDPVDRRHVKLSLTTKGELLLAGLFELTHQWMYEKLSLLDDEELNIIIHGLELIRSAFDKEAQSLKLKEGQ
jgi:DNA-binding MarR family transcriptional regulator